MESLLAGSTKLRLDKSLKLLSNKVAKSGLHFGLFHFSEKFAVLFENNFKMCYFTIAMQNYEPCLAARISCSQKLGKGRLCVYLTKNAKEAEKAVH